MKPAERPVVLLGREWYAIDVLYLIGFVIVIIGLSYGAYLAGISAEWIAVGIIVLFGVAILKITRRGRSSKPFDTA